MVAPMFPETRTAPRMTAEEFDRFADLPENADRRLEYVAGEVYEVPSNAYASKISSRFIQKFLNYLDETGIAGHVTGEQGGYRVFGGRYAPDAAYLSADKQPELDRRGYNSVPPDIAVEVDFPSSVESGRVLLRKVIGYLTSGATVWVVYPDIQTVEVFVPGKDPQTLGIDDTLDGGDALPGFKLPLKDVFR